jgi:hypothetical protein
MKPEESHIESEDGISRRRMLKRIGAGAAVAWTAPILTSIRTPAFAASPIGCEGCAPGPNFCTGEYTLCAPTCICGLRVQDASCVCYDIPGDCADCSTDADCVNLGLGTLCLQEDPACDTCLNGGRYCANLCSSRQGRSPKVRGRNYAPKRASR